MKDEAQRIVGVRAEQYRARRSLQLARHDVGPSGRCGAIAASPRVEPDRTRNPLDGVDLSPFAGCVGEIRAANPGSGSVASTLCLTPRRPLGATRSVRPVKS